MIKYLQAFSVVFSITLSAQMPIVLNNSNMPGNNDTLRYTNANPLSLGNYTQTGTNYTWDFSTLLSLSEGLRSFKSSLLTPYAFYFLSFNEYGEKIADTLGAGPIAITDYYNFYKKQTSPVNAFVADGVGMTFSSVPVPSYYSDKDELYIFPMTYPQYDSTTFKFSTVSNSLLPITYSKGGYRVTKVDGWGKVITPYDTVSCLRLISTQYANDTIKTSLGPITVPFGFANFQRSYQWMSTNSKIPFLEITGSLVNEVFSITQVRYRGYHKILANPVKITELSEEAAIQFYPNPVIDKIRINAWPEDARSFEVFTLQGKKLMSETLSPANKNKDIDVGVLDKGVYIFRIKTAGKSQSLRFIKE